MRRRARPRRVWRNADVDLRELERRAAEGDGEAVVLLLRARAQAGQLPTFPEVNTTMAYHSPVEGEWPFNEWAGGTNEWEFVDSALEGAATMRAAGGTPPGQP